MTTTAPPDDDSYPESWMPAHLRSRTDRTPPTAASDPLEHTTSSRLADDAYPANWLLTTGMDDL